MDEILLQTNGTRKDVIKQPSFHVLILLISAIESTVKRSDVSLTFSFVL